MANGFDKQNEAQNRPRCALLMQSLFVVAKLHSAVLPEHEVLPLKITPVLIRACLKFLLKFIMLFFWCVRASAASLKPNPGEGTHSDENRRCDESIY